MKIALIPCRECAWTRGGRLLGRVEVSPCDEDTQTSEWLSTLAPLALEAILHSPDELATQTAARLAAELGVKTRSVDSFKEVDLGLWSGLTVNEVRSRYATAARQLDDSPLSITPPDGERFSDALNRLSKALRDQIARRDRPFGVVLRPMALALAAHALTGQPPTGLLESATEGRTPTVLEPQAEAVADPS
ncbi:MAG: histidine phosphatase family protein [Phycisphaerales bacterium]|nr:histidine phosphatase family protein [Phycisphaerales bacterium]